MASAMAGFSPASRARRRCAWNSYCAVHLRPAMMIASSLSRGGIEVPKRTNAPTRWTRSHSYGLRRSALNGPRRPAPRGPDWMASATRFCSAVIVSVANVVNRPSLIAVPPLLGPPWPPARVDRPVRLEQHRQPLDASDEVRAELLWLRRGLAVDVEASVVYVRLVITTTLPLSLMRAVRIQLTTVTTMEPRRAEPKLAT